METEAFIKKPQTSTFRQAVLQIVDAIPKGYVATYSQIATLIGYPNHARLVGQILRHTEVSVPAHRVVSSSGRLVPGWEEQRLLLQSEGIMFHKNGNVYMKKAKIDFHKVNLMDTNDK